MSSFIILPVSHLNWIFVNNSLPCEYNYSLEFKGEFSMKRDRDKRDFWYSNKNYPLFLENVFSYFFNVCEKIHHKDVFKKYVLGNVSLRLLPFISYWNMHFIRKPLFVLLTFFAIDFHIDFLNS